MLQSFKGVILVVLVILSYRSDARLEPQTSSPCQQLYQSHKDKCHAQNVRCRAWSDDMIYQCPGGGPSGPYSDICENAYDSCMLGAHDAYQECVSTTI